MLPLYRSVPFRPLQARSLSACSSRPPQAKLANFHNLRLSRGLHFNDSLHASKAFRNPRIYAKLVEFVDVDETGSNWDKEIWDSKAIGPDATSSRLGQSSALGLRECRRLTCWAFVNSRTAKDPLRGETSRSFSALVDRVRAFHFILHLGCLARRRRSTQRRSQLETRSRPRSRAG